MSLASRILALAISEAAKVMREDDDDEEDGEENGRQAAAADALTDCAVKDVEGGITADESIAGIVYLRIHSSDNLTSNSIHTTAQLTQQ